MIVTVRRGSAHRQRLDFSMCACYNMAMCIGVPDAQRKARNPHSAQGQAHSTRRARAESDVTGSALLQSTNAQGDRSRTRRVKVYDRVKRGYNGQARKDQVRAARIPLLARRRQRARPPDRDVVVVRYLRRHATDRRGQQAMRLARLWPTHLVRGWILRGLQSPEEPSADHAI